ncbi:MAG TPA: DUF58 domain-containing protein [Cyclobacteriaceae bacterium]|nr:DUF58 domain-containing protein [Cyclobacteriaceae bacterium]HMV10084.1 DUF58 domain-containing protein [Cyclobacteriaceae bacterium]HMV88637.1 DUF58 domain-containing protein [Cyclobacteriaceae bacterium]HMX00601.1 DUF58 domain-containing protein [Cyclobacteriaceae bacterium]HMX49524.1 DUF58 domain-containing protein [Cyclobacteriaceae bacterium]
MRLSFKSFFLNNRFFGVGGAILLVLVLAFPFEVLLPVALTSILIFLLLVLFDTLVLYGPRISLNATRAVSKVLSLGDDNPIKINIRNNSSVALTVAVVDELPEQFQVRNFKWIKKLAANKSEEFEYQLKPLTRGEYFFGDLHCFVRTDLGLVRRRITFPVGEMIPVYPSIIQMKRFELKSFIRTSSEYGVKRMQRIGHSYEFEHIKHYVAGDDFRSINWKATGRRAQLMVNQYEDEKSQQVYCLLDRSRVMHMPFGGLSLLDYSVNASLVISNIVLQKQDKSGLLTFSDRIGTAIKAERSKQQLKKILEALYNEEEQPVEANYELMYVGARRFIKGRSLLFLFTNFESEYALQRVIPQLRNLNRQHLLVVVFFENTEISDFSKKPSYTLEDVYAQVTAEDHLYQKMQLVQQLKQFGIMSILTKPENLTVNTINKYLELKSRGLI